MSKNHLSRKKRSPSAAVRADDAATVRAPNSAALAAVIEAVAARVLKLSLLHPEDIAELLESERGSQMMDIDPRAAGVRGDVTAPLQSWAAVKVASPVPLTDARYERFLKGQDPIAESDSDSQQVELYGAHLA